MNAIRQIATTDASGNLSIQVPTELRQRPVEIIVMPIDETNNLGPLLTGTNAVTNAWKIIRKIESDSLLNQSISVLQQEATKNGLTSELLDELLKNE